MAHPTDLTFTNIRYIKRLQLRSAAGALQPLLSGAHGRRSPDWLRRLSRASRRSIPTHPSRGWRAALHSRHGTAFPSVHLHLHGPHTVTTSSYIHVLYHANCWRSDPLALMATTTTPDPLPTPGFFKKIPEEGLGNLVRMLNRPDSPLRYIALDAAEEEEEMRSTKGKWAPGNWQSMWQGGQARALGGRGGERVRRAGTASMRAAVVRQAGCGAQPCQHPARPSSSRGVIV